MKKIIIGNLKANLTPNSTRDYLHNLDSMTLNENCETIILPNQASLLENNFKNLNIGVQNAYPIHSGAFTGEIGLDILNELKINTILLGHSERRELKEGYSLILEKFNFFKNHNFKIILCIGEGISQKNGGRIDEFLLLQLKDIDLDYENLIIAYEPLWAVGSGVTPTLEEIGKIINNLKIYGVKKAIYGGSVDIHNAKSIINITDGLLIGGASINFEEFAKIINIA